MNRQTQLGINCCHLGILPGDEGVSKGDKDECG